MSKYINIDYSTGTLYHYSKEQENPDYKEHKSSSGSTGYRCHFFKGVEGYLQNVSLVTNPQNRSQISIFLESKDNEYLYVNIDLFTQRGTITEYAESFIRFVNALQKGKYYNMSTYKMDATFLEKKDKEAGKEPRGKYYDMLGVSIKEVDSETLEVIEKVEPTLVYKGNGDNVVPSLVFEVDLLTTKRKPTPVSIAEREGFLKAKLSDAIHGHLKREKREETKDEVKPNSSADNRSTKETSEGAPAAGVDVDIDDDDLPF